MLSAGQVTDSFIQALGRPPTGEELQRYSSRGDLEGSSGQSKVISEIKPVGGSTGGTGTLADQLIKASTDSYNKLWEDYKSKSDQFDAANPFNFDQMLETQTAQVANRLDPYYTQTLTDYLTGVNNTRNRTIEDRQNLLTDLSADTSSYTGSAKMALDKAINTSKEGYIDSGLYGSGKQLNDQGTIQTTGNQNLADYLRGQDVRARNINQTADRGLTDINLASTQKVRDLKAEQQYNTTSQALTETQRQQQQREYEKAQVTGAPPGATPAQYNTYTTSLLA